MSSLASAIAAVVLAIIPGPAMTYGIARPVAGGRSEGLASCLLSRISGTTMAGLGAFLALSRRGS